MKKVIGIILIMLFLLVCYKASENAMTILGTDSKEVSTGKYQIFNSLGSRVTELYLYKTGEEKGKNRIAQNGLNVGEHITLSFDADEDTMLTIEYVTEDGKTGKFSNLAIEEAPINLLAEDARTGPTVLEFVKPEGDGVYTIYNLTGGTVTELYLHEANANKGINLAGKGLANNNRVDVKYHGTLDTVLILEYKADNGESGIFENLAIEEAPISLISTDARTGPTAISFTKPN